MPRSPTHTANGTASIAYAVQAAALAVTLLATATVSGSPVLATFSSRAGSSEAGSSVVPIASVDLGWALVTVLVGGAVTHAFAWARCRGHADESRASQRDGILAAGWSQGSGILVFLVAQLNGIAELASLVPLFAITATAVVLVSIDPGGQTLWRRPSAWAAVVGIVPWGVIAFAQIGAGIAVGAPSPGVRIVTLLALAVAVIGWLIGWRHPRSTRSADVIAITVAVSALVWSLVAFVVLGTV